MNNKLVQTLSMSEFVSLLISFHLVLFLYTKIGNRTKSENEVKIPAV